MTRRSQGRWPKPRDGVSRVSTHTAFIWTYPASASAPEERPWPEAPKPPNGTLTWIVR